MSHHLAAAKAADGVAGLTPPQPGRLLRELLANGQLVQSHSKRFLHLAAPDLVFGFDADPATRNVLGIVQTNPQPALKTVNLRRYGQQIIERLGGKRVHPYLAVPGDCSAPLKTADRDAIAAERETMVGYAQEAIGLAGDLLGADPRLTAEFAAFPSAYMGMVDAAGNLELYDGAIRAVASDGSSLTQFDAAHHREHIAEHVEPRSFLKFPYLRGPGWPAGAYRVGPPARLNVAEGVRTPLARAELRLINDINGGRPVEGSLFCHLARLIEALYALERIGELLDDPEILSGDIRAEPATELTGHGVGAIEAPRGTHFHEYWTDEHGLLLRVNLIVATGHNNWAMNRAAGAVARVYIDGDRLTEGVLNRVEAAIRCCDPCLSCATHAPGQMPLQLTLVAADGRVLDEARRLDGQGPGIAMANGPL